MITRRREIYQPTSLMRWDGRYFCWLIWWWNHREVFTGDSEDIYIHNHTYILKQLHMMIWYMFFLKAYCTQSTACFYVFVCLSSMKPGISHMGMDQKSDPNGCNSMRHFGDPPFLVNDFTGRSESQRMVRITIGKVKLSKRWPAFLMWELQWFARQIDEFDVWEVLQPINLCCRAQTGPTQWRMVGERVNLFSLRCTKTWYQDVYGVPSKNDWKGMKRLKG